MEVEERAAKVIKHGKNWTSMLITQDVRGREDVATLD